MAMVYAEGGNLVEVPDQAIEWINHITIQPGDSIADVIYEYDGHKIKFSGIPIDRKTA